MACVSLQLASHPLRTGNRGPQRGHRDSAYQPGGGAQRATSPEQPGQEGRGCQKNQEPTEYRTHSTIENCVERLVGDVGLCCRHRDNPVGKTESKATVNFRKNKGKT